MAILPPQTHKWPSDRAVLFIHGIGSSKQGDYDPLVDQLKEMLGADAKKFAIYFLYYDQVNDWFAAKIQAGAVFTKLVEFISSKQDGSALGDASRPGAGAASARRR